VAGRDRMQGPVDIRTLQVGTGPGRVKMPVSGKETQTDIKTVPTRQPMVVSGGAGDTKRSMGIMRAG
ncbi:MAG: hypothetical protein LUE26_03890, partial [Alistipes sp.]|nr:hypothetical protein [Alistipes sp.]